MTPAQRKRNASSIASKACYRNKFFMVLRSISKIFAGLVGLAFFISFNIFANTRFETVNGNLIDHTTQLMWRSIESTTLNYLPTSPELTSGWRIADGLDIVNLGSNFGWLGGSFSTNSDIFKALSFFSTQFSTNSSYCGIFVLNTNNCFSFSGWASSLSPWYSSKETPYDARIFAYSYTDEDTVLAKSTSTVGSYTQSNCRATCGGPYSFFTVQSIPEPSEFTMLSFGLIFIYLIHNIRQNRPIN